MLMGLTNASDMCKCPCLTFQKTIKMEAAKRLQAHHYHKVHGKRCDRCDSMSCSRVWQNKYGVNLLFKIAIYQKYGSYAVSFNANTQDVRGKSSLKE